ncbi:G-protein-signaling modulator 2 isoform X1 [Phlebotomus argentipes]|uniref:G-protein-signaling modulator 2 isoform X1 n=1 Tax=Phlebotomus argentipes TaxID=94469 RepID=UPI0028934326|nr:G-protein-signaling modulator 2 isoform X1 [Phlebotomus argentipes]
MSSLSASAENLTDTQTNDGSSMCLELALEGERLCKSGDCRAGVAFFQAAIQAGTDDLRILSAIYSQLGNAYFYLGDYAKAMDFHKLDLTLARSMNDKLGEAKSSGNLGNTLKVMGRFDEAAICCERHLTLARQLGDRLSESRALYNLGNVYHSKGKHMGQRDPGDFSDDVKEALMKAVGYYQQNLALMRQIGDRGAQGRACGNLGNTYYLLGDFQAAIVHHQERLSIAREFGDKAAERRANSNLGNSHIFLGQFELAAENYKRTLSLAIELGERAVEAQACYSLGNTYTLLKDFSLAIEYHQRHLAIAQELGDKVGEARACWSLGNAYSAIGNYEKALHYAQSHYSLATELGDPVGESTARMNITDLRKVLGLPEITPTDFDAMSSDSQRSKSSPEEQETAQTVRQYRVRRQSMEQLDLLKLTPDGKKVEHHTKSESGTIMQEDDFFDLLTNSQSKRMDDQRCTLKVAGGSVSVVEGAMRKPLTAQNRNPPQTKDNRNALLEMIADLQSERMDEQRATLPGLVNRAGLALKPPPGATGVAPDDAFLDMLMRCQGSRLEEQRSELPRPGDILEDSEEGTRRGRSNIGATVPDEDFFSLISRVQGGRMEDQRAAVPLGVSRRLAMPNNVHVQPPNATTKEPGKKN